MTFTLLVCVAFCLFNCGRLFDAGHYTTAALLLIAGAACGAIRDVLRDMEAGK